MTAQPVHRASDDPAEVLRALPERWHEQFLREYHEALDATQEVWRFRQLRDVLHLWQLRSVAYANPDLDAAAAAARSGRTTNSSQPTRFSQVGPIARDLPRGLPRVETVAQLAGHRSDSST